jgi:hypothetical protein
MTFVRWHDKIKHYKGGEYRLLGPAKFQVSIADGGHVGHGAPSRRVTDQDKVYVYRDFKDGEMYVRFGDEFGEARFEHIGKVESAEFLLAVSTAANWAMLGITLLGIFFGVAGMLGWFNS